MWHGRPRCLSLWKSRKLVKWKAKIKKYLYRHNCSLQHNLLSFVFCVLITVGSSGYHLHFLLCILTGRETNEKNEMAVITLLFAEVRFPTKRGLVQFINLAYVVPGHEQKLCHVFFNPKVIFLDQKIKFKTMHKWQKCLWKEGNHLPNSSLTYSWLLVHSGSRGYKGPPTHWEFVLPSSFLTVAIPTAIWKKDSAPLTLC